MIGLIDIDLLDRQTNFPNLALMKLSAWNKLRGETTNLVLTPDDALACERVFCSKVFTFSKRTGLDFVNRRSDRTRRHRLQLARRAEAGI